MSSEWDSVEIGAVAKLRSGFPFKSADWTDEGVPVIKIANVKNGRIVRDGCGFVAPEVAQRTPEWFTKDGDVLIAMTGYVGEVALVQTGEQYLINQRVGRFEFHTGAAVDPKFFFYHLQLPATRSEIEGVARGSAQPNLSAADAHKIKLTLPPVAIQKEISGILGALDDRITLLRETNTTLEAIAQALFKSWFVDFDPVHAKMQGRGPEGMDEATAALFPDSFEDSELGPVPKGWPVLAVEDFAARVGMGPFGSNIKVETFVESGIPVISGQHLKQLLVEDNTFNFITPEHAQRLSKSCVQAGDVIFTHAGSIGQVSLLHKDSAYLSYVLSQRQFFLRCNEALVNPEWVALYFRSPEGQHKLLANTSQVGVPSIARPVSYLRSIRMVVPPPSVGQSFASIARSINQRVMANRKQLATLVSLRDTLLPRLISGQLRIEEAAEALA